MQFSCGLLLLLRPIATTVRGSCSSYVVLRGTTVLTVTQADCDDQVPCQVLKWLLRSTSALTSRTITTSTTSIPTEHPGHRSFDFQSDAALHLPPDRLHRHPLDSTRLDHHQTPLDATYLPPDPTRLSYGNATQPRPRRLPESQPGTDASDTTVVKRALFSEQLEPAFSTTKIHELPSRQLTTY